MSGEYPRALRREIVATAAKWLGAVELLITLTGYVGSLYLWFTDAPAWQIVAALAFSVGLTFVLFHLSAQRAWATEREARRAVEAERDQLLEDRKPKLEIVFLPENDEDSRPYLQTLRFFVVDEPVAGVTKMRIPMIDRRYRIGVRNLSSATIPRVRVRLERCVPGGNMIHIGHDLLVMATDPPSGAADLAPSAAGEPTLFFDVVNALGEEGDDPERFQFCYAIPGICGPVEGDRNYDIILRVDGGNVSTSRAFRISQTQSPDGRLRMMSL